MIFRTFKLSTQLALFKISFIKHLKIMKKNLLYLMLGMLFLTGSLPIKAQETNSYLGNWSFEAPTAPEGYTQGIITFKKDSSFMTFTDGNYKYPSDWLTVKNDSVKYQSDIDGTTVLFSLKIIEKNKLKGNATWSSGETIMILTKKE
jgi:hypothetical protein